MKKQILSLSLIAISFGVIFTSCKKDAKTDDNSNNTEISTHSDDESRFQNETDAVANDVNIALETYGSFTGRNSNTQTFICNAQVAVDSVSDPRTITITYNGASCFGNTSRSGIVVLSMAQGVHWKDAGAALTVSYQNLNVTRLSDNKSIKINGIQTFTNVSGGLLIQLPSLTSITHTITSSGMTVVFDDNTQRTWQVAKQRVFTYNNGVNVSTTGTHTEGNDTNIAEWGTNRFGHEFTAAITQPMTVAQECNFRLTGGQVTHKSGGITATATFGLDANGNPTTCPVGAYYFKIVWTGPNGNSLSFIWPY